jgi:hypothetical protein
MQSHEKDSTICAYLSEMKLFGSDQTPEASSTVRKSRTNLNAGTSMNSQQVRDLSPILRLSRVF